MVTPAILDVIRNYLLTVNENGIPVSFGVLFGSQAKGTAHSESDIDLVVASSHFDGHKEYSEVSKLWRLTAQTDYRIEPIPVGEKEWIEDDSRAIIEIARREGQLIRI